MIKYLIKRHLLNRNFFYKFSRSLLYQSSHCVHQEAVSDLNSLQGTVMSNPQPNLNRIASFYQQFTDYGLPIDTALGILKTYPELLKIPPEKLNDTLDAWIKCNLGEEFKDIILTHPSVLFLSKEHIQKRYKGLIQLFPRKVIGKVILNSPLVVAEPLVQLHQKVSFLEKEMKYTINEIIKSGALSSSYEQIKNRFKFMILAGVFKIPNPKILEATKTINPQLGSILSLNKHDFANKIVGVSLLEYTFFEDMMHNEEDSSNEENDDVT